MFPKIQSSIKKFTYRTFAKIKKIRMKTEYFKMCSCKMKLSKVKTYLCREILNKENKESVISVNTGCWWLSSLYSPNLITWKRDLKYKKKHNSTLQIYAIKSSRIALEMYSPASAVCPPGQDYKHSESKSYFNCLCISSDWHLALGSVMFGGRREQ